MKMRLLTVNAITAMFAANLFAVADLDYALIGAAWNGDVKAVSEVIEAGADVNATDGDGHTVLHEAARLGHLEMVMALLQAGADINVIDNFECTALRLAIGEGHVEVVIVLLQAGADVNAAFWSQTAEEMQEPKDMTSWPT